MAKKIEDLLNVKLPGFDMTSSQNLDDYSMDEEESTPENDPSAFEPALPEGQEITSGFGQLASDEDIKKIHDIPLPEAQAALRNPMADTAIENEIDEANAAFPETSVDPVLTRRENLLKELHEQRASGQRTLGMLQGGNQIAQAIASGYGGKLGDGSEAIKMLHDDLNQPIKDYKEGIENEENVPDSDISKMMRERAYAMLKSINPKKEYNLENMTANQLKKAFGQQLSKGLSHPKSGQQGDYIHKKTGNPLAWMPDLNKYVDSVTGETPESGQIIGRVLRKDSLTEMYGYNDSNGGLMVQPTQYGNLGLTLQAKKNSDTGEVENIKYGDFMKAVPAVAKKVDKIIENFSDDMKDTRKTAAASLMMQGKLQPGTNDAVDSGLLGGVQTQAAKISGQSGVLTDQDLAKFGGVGGWLASAKRFVKAGILGEMTKGDVEFFNRFAEIMDNSLEKIIENDAKIYVKRAKQIADAFAPGISDDNVREWLGVGYVAPNIQDKKSDSDSKQTQEKSPPSDMVKVKGPSGEVQSIKKSAWETKYSKKKGFSLIQE